MGQLTHRSTGAQLYLDIVKPGYLFHAVGNVMTMHSDGLQPEQDTHLWSQ